MKNAIQSFDSALAESNDGSKRHLLMGNGFSRAWNNNIFDYRALLKQADFSGISKEARDAFGALSTSDFERVMRALRDAASILQIYGSSNPDLIRRLNDDANQLREVLVKAIATSHPDHPDAITGAQYSACRTFLGHFDNL